MFNSSRAVLVILAFIFSACTKDNSRNFEDLVYEFETDLTIPKSTLENSPAVISQIINSEVVDFEDVTSALIHEDSSQFFLNLQKKSKTRISDTYKDQFQNSFLKDVTKFFAPLNISNSFLLRDYIESLLVQKNKKSIQIDPKAKFLSDLFNENKLNYLTGTHLNILSLRLIQGYEKYMKDNHVVVFTPGQMNPGKIIQAANDRFLVQQNILDRGEALILMGRTSELSGCMRVLDADLYAIFLILKPYLTESQISTLSEEVELLTAEKYNFDLNSMGSGNCPENSSFVSFKKPIDSYFAVGLSSLKSDYIRKQNGTSTSELLTTFAQMEQARRLDLECASNPFNCLILPIVGMVQARFYLRQNKQEDYFIPYIFEDNVQLTKPRRDVYRAFTFLLPESDYYILKGNIQKQCELILHAHEISILKNKNIKSIYEVAEVYFDVSQDVSRTQSSFRLSSYGQGYTHSIRGHHVLSDNDLLRVDAQVTQLIQNEKKISYLMGHVPFIRNMDMNGLVQKCSSILPGVEK